MVAGVFEVLADDPEDGDFDAGFIARATGKFIFSEARSSRQRLVRSVGMIQRGGSDSLAIRAQLSGRASGRMNGNPVEIQAGDVLFVDLLQTLDLQIETDGEPAADVTVWIPRARLHAAIADESALHGLVVPGNSAAGALISGCLRLLSQHVESSVTRELDALVDGFVEMTARSIAPVLDRLDGSGARKSLAPFVTIRRYIDRNLATPALDADQVAATFGLSRASLYRLFEPVGGVARYIRTARLKRAYQDIGNPELSNQRIGQTAYRFGFKNVSAFNRLFQDAYGVSPSFVRKMGPTALAVSLRTRSPAKDSLANWLAQLG